MDNANSFYQRKYSSAVAFFVGALLFLLPFVEIKCNNQPFAQNTGLGLALGLDYKVSASVNSLNPFDDKATAGSSTKEEGKMYVLALAALVMGAAGLLLSIGSRPWHFFIFILGTAAAVCMLALMVQISTDVSSNTKKDSSGDINLGAAVQVSVVFTLWYYLSMLAFVAAAFLSWKKRELLKKKKVILQENPGTLFDKETQGIRIENQTTV